MRLFSFSKFSPAGNSTVFLHAANDGLRQYYCRKALATEYLGAEQAAYADISGRKLAMGGGEFCVNACRAFGALLDCAAFNNDCNGAEAELIFRQARHYEITASGYSGPVFLEVEGQIPQWRVSARFEMENVPLQGKAPHIHLASLQGISHLLLRAQSLPDARDVPDMAADLARQYNIDQMDAYGVTWWTQAGGRLQIIPFVCVPKSGTAVLENSCGSASLSLALLLNSLRGQQTFSILQPGGDMLEIALRNGYAAIGGPVLLVARGAVWLPKPHAFQIGGD